MGDGLQQGDEQKPSASDIAVNLQKQIERNRTGNHRHSGKWTIWAGFAVALVCLSVIGVASYFGVGNVRRDAALAGRIEGTLSLLEELRFVFAQAESNQRWFVVTGDEGYSSAFETGRARVETILGRVREETARYSNERPDAELLTKTLHDRWDAFRATIDLRRTAGPAAARAAMDDTAGKERGAQIFQLIARMTSDLEAMEASYERRSSESARATRVTIVCSSLFTLVVACLGLFVILRDFSGRTNAERILVEQAALLEKNNDLLESRVTERTKDVERAHEQLISREALLRSVTECARVGLVIVSEDHRYLFANRAYSEILNLPPGDIVGRRVADLVAPVYETQIRPRLEQAFAGERVSYELQVPAPAPASGQRCYTVNYEPGSDQTGKFVVVVISEITALKIAEEELRKSLRETVDLRTALNVHAIVAVTDAQGRITEVNQKFCEISKYSREELLGQDHRLVNSGTHSKEFFRELWQTIGQGRVWQGDIKNKAKDGSFYWVATTIVPFLDESGKPRQYVAIRADITARKLAEEARARLAGIVRSSSDAIIGKTLDGTITSWNSGAETVFGYTEAEAVGRSMLMLFPADRVSEETHILACIARDETVPHFETQRIRKDGRLIDVSVTISPVYDSEGRVVAASKIARDITEQKRAEAALRNSEARIRDLNTDLERRVQERTVQLEAANKELEAFSYSVSHDLRSPLRAMDGFSQALQEDLAPVLPEEGKEYLQSIRSGAQRMGALIDDLLTFSRLSRSPLARREVDSEKLVSAVLDDLEHQIAGRKMEIRRGTLPACEGDQSLLKQVWVNLLSNAFKYTLRSPEPVVEIGSMEQEGETVYFVRDNGAGFDMRYAKKLFGVFQRLHRAEDYEGTGVGLAIVQRIVHRHGGRVWAEAAVNQGATFYFTLAKGASS
ncbi:MAG TPA: PAS domain S-box protein [Chthoniobacter sp.]|jgi:PAS domain S-box-containing protein